MPSPTSKGKSSLAFKGKMAVIAVVALMVMIYFTTFIMQVQACDQAIEAIHNAYEKKLQNLRNAFNEYKQEHGGKKKDRGGADFDVMMSEMQRENAAILGKGNLTRDEFNSMFLEECFRRFETMPWDSKDFSQQDRDELLQLWETVKPQSKADVDRPLPRKKYHQLQRILQQFYVKITKKGYSNSRYNVNAPKFFLHKAANEIELLQIKPQMNKLHHEWIQSGQTNTNETLGIITKLIHDRGLNNALGSFVANINLVIKDPDDLDYYYEYNYYSDEYLLQLNAEAEQLKEASKVADQMGGAGSGYKKGSELSVEEKRAHLVRNVGGNNAEAVQQAANAKRAYEMGKAEDAARAKSKSDSPTDSGILRQRHVPKPPPGGDHKRQDRIQAQKAAQKAGSGQPPGMGGTPKGGKLRGSGRRR